MALLLEQDDPASAYDLLDALQRFDANAGASFSTFASQRIRGAMIDELRTRDWLPRSVRRTARAVDQCVHRLEQKLGRPAEEREIANEMGMDLEQYRQLLTDTNNGLLLPYEEMVAERGEPEAGSGSPPSPFAALVDSEQREQLTAAIETLPEREKLLLALYYQEELNLKEIGAVLGVTESRALCSSSNGRGAILPTTSSAGPSSTASPKYMTIMRSEIWCTSARSWAITRNAICRRS